MRLKKCARLRKTTDYEFVRRNAERAHTGAFVLYLTRAPQESAGAFSRFGVVASKRVGGAVERNKIKRRWREIYRTNQEVLPHCDIVLHAKRASLNTPYSELENMFLLCCQKLAVRLEKREARANKEKSSLGEKKRSPGINRQ